MAKGNTGASVNTEAPQQAKKAKVIVLKSVDKQTFGPKVFFAPFVEWCPENWERDWPHGLTIPEAGITLDLSIQRNQTYLDIIEKNAYIKAFITPNSGSQRYEMIDIEQKAKDYIKSAENQDALKRHIWNLKDTADDAKILRTARSLGISTDDVSTALMNMMEMNTTNQGKQTLANYFQSEDRDFIDVIHGGLAKGNANDKQGLYKTPAGIYKYNAVSIGTSIEDVLAFLKDADNAGVYLELKKQTLED